MDIVYVLLIGAAAGWLAGNLIKGGGFGPLWNVIIGVGGGMLGRFVFPIFGLSIGGGLLGHLLNGTLGALLLLVIIGFVQKNKP